MHEVATLQFAHRRVLLASIAHCYGTQCPQPGHWGGCISGQSTLRAYVEVATGSSVGTVPISIPVLTSTNRQFPGGAVILRYIRRGSVELDPLRIGFW